MELSPLLPEITVGLLAIAVIALDLVLEPRRRGALAYLAIVGLAVAIALAAARAGTSATSFFGTLVVDPLALFFKILFMVAAALVILSSSDYVRRHRIAPGEFYATILFATLGFMFVVSTRELLTLYVSLELASISLYILAGIMKHDARSSEAGIKYLLIGALSSAVLLYGIALIYGVTGSTDLATIGRSLTAPSPVVLAGIVMLTAGLGFKVAVVPFHMWVPDVYQGAPTPTTAFVSVVSKSAGFAIVLRVFVGGLAGLDQAWPTLFAVLAAITMTVGNVGALRQSNVKRLMGYSSIGQAGYAMMALAAPGVATSSSLIFFLLAYTLTNVGAFAGIIALSDQVGSDEIIDYRGLAQRSLGLALLTTLCFLSLIGMPPMAGFVSKIYLFLQVFQSGPGLLWLVLVAVLNTAVAAYYYIKVVRALFLANPLNPGEVRAAPGTRLTLWASAIAILVVGILPGPFIDWATAAAQSLFAR